MNKVDKAIKALLDGHPIIVVDREDRENEGDIVIAGERANRDNIVFTMRYARGLMCVPASGDILDHLDIPMMVKESTDKLQTPFTVSVDAAYGISTGMSVSDRLKTLSIFDDPEARPSDLARPGHLFPLRARPNLLLDRQGHTESSIELMRLADLHQFAIITEIVNDDGTMARGDSLRAFQETHNLHMIAVEDIYDTVYRSGV